MYLVLLQKYNSSYFVAVTFKIKRILFSSVWYLLLLLVFFFFSDHFYFPAQLVGGFTLSDLLDKPCSQVGVVPSPPRYVPSFFIAHTVQHSHCSSSFIECC